MLLVNRLVMPSPYFTLRNRCIKQGMLQQVLLWYVDTNVGQSLICDYAGVILRLTLTLLRNTALRNYASSINVKVSINVCILLYINIYFYIVIGRDVNGLG